MLSESTKNKYNIGGKVFYATFTAHAQVYMECPDCGGTGRIRVIFHDESVVSIDCGNCSQGFNPPTGKILVDQNKPDVKLAEITGMEIRSGKETNYNATLSSGGNCWILEESKLFKTKEEAQKKAEKMHAEFIEEEKKRIYKKEKDTRSWAWNASYHKQCIKRAEIDIKYHTEKLNAANLKKNKEHS